MSDEKTGVDLNNDGTIDYYTANVVSANDYYPFGMMMPARTFRGGPGIYRFGFNRQEKSIEIDPNGNSMTAEFWQYDARLGKRWNVDPRLTTGVSPYSAFLNNPILNIDPIGDTTINGQLMEGTNPASAIYLQEIVLKATRHSKVPNLERDFSAAITRDLKALEITPDQLKDKIVGKVLHELLPPLPDAIQKPLDRARQLHKFGKVMTGMHEQGGKSPFPSSYLIGGIITALGGEGVWAAKGIDLVVQEMDNLQKEMEESMFSISHAAGIKRLNVQIDSYNGHYKEGFVRLYLSKDNLLKIKTDKGVARETLSAMAYTTMYSGNENTIYSHMIYFKQSQLVNPIISIENIGYIPTGEPNSK